MPTREEAIAVLTARGLHDAADFVCRWRNRQGQNGGWDRALRAHDSAAAAALWPSDAAHRGRRRATELQSPAPDEAAIRRAIAALRRPSGVECAFDAYWAVDWSGRSKPCAGRASIWSALLWWPEDPGSSPLLELENPPTRHAFMENARRRLTGDLGRSRVLLGLDFPFGYPRGFAAALGDRAQCRPPWRVTYHRLTREIADAPDNTNNRLEVAARLNAALTGTFGPFWGRPVNADSEREVRGHRELRAFLERHLSVKRKSVFAYPVRTRQGIVLREKRITDVVARTRSSSWFVHGGGNSVGGQALVGIPRLWRLRKQVRDARIWPFETGASLPDRDLARVVCAEIYPSLVYDARARGTSSRTREETAPTSATAVDALQVLAVVHAMAERDVQGTLDAWFSAPCDHPAVLQEEGWILGAVRNEGASQMRGR